MAKSSKYLVAPISALMDDRLTKSERLVLLGLYSFHNNKTGHAVWPSRETLAKVSSLNDLDRVGKLTTALAKKGWLTKKRKGYTNVIEYQLHVPAYVHWSMFGDALCRLDALTDHVETTVQAETTGQAKTTCSVQAETTCSEQAETTGTKEQTILTNQLTNHSYGESDINCSLFDRFWNEYPKQIGRKKTYETWLRLNPSEQDLEVMLINISDRLNQGAWSLDTKQYISHPSNYLENEQWADEIISRKHNGQDANGNKLSPGEQVRQAIEQEERDRQRDQHREQSFGQSIEHEECGQRLLVNTG